MSKFDLKRSVAKAVAAVFMSITLPLAAAPIDLNDFFLDGVGSIEADCSAATLMDDASTVVSLLSNDPGLGDAEVIVASAGGMLTFDRSLTGGADEFVATLFDSAIGPFGGLLDKLFEVGPGSGSHAFDLSAYAGIVLGLEFQLIDADGLINGTLRVSNLDVSGSGGGGGPSVPTPGTAALLLAGLLGLRSLRRGAASADC